MTFRPLTQLDDLDIVLDRSYARPVLLFKHSATCGISAQAHEHLQSIATDAERVVDSYLVPVRAARAVSDAIAKRLRVRHESPQILLVVDGAVRWQASHFRVTAEAVGAAIDALASQSLVSDK